MTNKQATIWWLYSISAIVLIFFLAPTLISASDTFLVLLGVLLIVLFAVWSYHLWIKRLFKLIKDSYSEL